MRVATPLITHTMQRSPRVTRGLGPRGLRMRLLGDLYGPSPLGAQPPVVRMWSSIGVRPTAMANAATHAQHRKEQYGRALQHYGLVVDHLGNVIRLPRF